MHAFRTAGKIATGKGALACVGTRAAALGSKALLVTGRHAMRRSGATGQVVDLLAQAGVDVATF